MFFGLVYSVSVSAEKISHSNFVNVELDINAQSRGFLCLSICKPGFLLIPKKYKK